MTDAAYAISNSSRWDANGRIASTSASTAQAPKIPNVEMIGGAERDRTADLLVANEALSQLSYSPTVWVTKTV